MKQLQRQDCTDWLTQYDPEKGLKTIAVATAAVNHYARAKDPKRLHQAIRGKLTAQAEFVVWWDSQAKDKGGRPRKTSDRSVSGFQHLGRNGLPEQKVVDRWRPLTIPEKFQTLYRKACDRYVKILELRTGATAGMHYPESNEWYTPKKYVEAARAVMGGIDIDPASSAAANETIRARVFYSVDDNGLQQQWHGRVWLNPPYGGNADRFVQRLVEQYTAGVVTQAILVVNSHSTDSAWFRPLWDHLLCFTDHRINFISPASGEESGSNHGSVFIYFGAERSAFLREFNAFGAIVERAS